VVDISLKDQAAVVTGGGRGVGRAIARSLARAGARVLVAAKTENDVDETAALIRREGGHAVPVSADITDQDAVERLVGEAEQRLGPISLLVNNAGTCGAIGPLWQIDPEDWRLDVESSLFGSFLCARAVLPGMVERRAGRIINVSSYAAIRPTPHMAAYGCTKAALLHLTNSLAAEAEPYGVAVFAITPGRVRTAMTEYMLESPAGKRWLDMPTDEWLAPKQAGRLAVILSSGRADALSGRFIHVLDDVNELVRHAEEIRKDDLYVLRFRT
jgi:NAD(P)-dependent dehydrogenase (short-subunit alcohol dehydrogenase family)